MCEIDKILRFNSLEGIPLDYTFATLASYNNNLKQFDTKSLRSLDSTLKFSNEENEVVYYEYDKYLKEGGNSTIKDLPCDNTIIKDVNKLIEYSEKLDELNKNTQDGKKKKKRSELWTRDIEELLKIGNSKNHIMIMGFGHIVDIISNFSTNKKDYDTYYKKISL
ncbi:hypothetical protein [Francisella frigiditurris]|nr:hypothetical protein [Francisella frigiditurris]